jgi:hypothetical protein
LRRHGGVALVAAFGEAPHETHVLAFDVAILAELARKSVKRGQRLRRQHADDIHALLRAQQQRPSGCRAAEQRYELAPFQLTELHSLRPTGIDSITDWRANGHGVPQCGISVPLTAEPI